MQRGQGGALRRRRRRWKERWRWMLRSFVLNGQLWLLLHFLKLPDPVEPLLVPTQVCSHEKRVEMGEIDAVWWPAGSIAAADSLQVSAGTPPHHFHSAFDDSWPTDADTPPRPTWSNWELRAGVQAVVVVEGEVAEEAQTLSEVEETDTSSPLRPVREVHFAAARIDCHCKPPLLHRRLLLGIVGSHSAVCGCA